MISTGFLNKLTIYANEEISKVSLNDGEHTITAFDVKAAADNLLTMNYIIPNGSVVNVTKIELQNDADEVISSNTADIPINADLVMIHTVEVKEVD